MLASRIRSLKQRAMARDRAIATGICQHCLCDWWCLPDKKNLDLFCPCTGNHPGKAITVALPSMLLPTILGHQDFGVSLVSLCVLWETEQLWHSFTQMGGKRVFPLRYTGRISECMRAWSAHANPELGLQSASSSPRCKELFHLHSKASPYPCHDVHVETQTWCGIHLF